jgi:menaquinone-9 beta-reductase
MEADYANRIVMSIPQEIGCTHESADVIVIGGGPAGSAAALCLAREGCSVILLERQIIPHPSHDCLRSGEGLIPRTLRELSELGVDTSHPSWALSQIRHVRVSWPDGSCTSNNISQRGGIMQIDRGAFEAELLSAAHRAGVDVRVGWRARRLHRASTGSVAGAVVQSAGDKQPYLIRAPVIIDASGRNALSFRQFDLRTINPADDFFAVVLFFAQVGDLLPDVWEMHLFDSSRLTVVQLSQLTPGIIRCGLGMCGPIVHSPLHRPEEIFWASIQAAPELARRLEHSQIVRRPYVRASISYRVRQVTFDGLVLVGDAAGYLNPLFGDGILRALVTARHAAGVVASALQRGDCSRAGLIKYERRHDLHNRCDDLVRYLIRTGYRHPALIARLGTVRLVRDILFAALMRT